MKNINKYLKSSLVLAAFVYSVGTIIPMQSTYADETNTELVKNETVKEWKPEGNIIAQGEDGVPWELYENGYLLFTPVEGKDTLGITNSDGTMNGLKFSTSTTESLQEFKNKIKAISFSGKTYLPSWPNMNFFALFKNLEFFDGENLDLSKTDSLYTLFLGNEKLNNVKLENWDVSHIRTFRGMFADTSIKKLDLSKWNFNEAPNSTKEDLFGGAESLEEITLPESFFNLTERDKKYFENENEISIFSLTGLNIIPQKTNIHNDKWVRKEDKKEINDFSELKMTDKSNAGTWTRRYKRIVFRDLEIKDIVSFDDELNNQELPLPKNPPENEKNNIVFKGWTNFESRWDKPIKIYKTVGDVLNAYEGKENYYYVDLKTEWGTVDNTKKETKIIPIETKYIPNTELELNKKEIESNGKEGQKEIVTTYQVTPITGELTNPSSTENIITPMQPKIIKVGTKPKIEIIKNNSQTIERTTNYSVDEKTGELTETITDKVISINTPLISNPNGNDEPELNINNKPEYKEDVSTNITIDEKENEILPPIVDKLPEFNGGVNSIEPPVTEKPEYTGTLSTNTPIDENGNLILPPVVEKPEFNGSVNSTEPPVENKPEYKEPISTNTPVDDNGNLILPPVVNDLPEFNGNINHTETLVNEVSENTVPSNNSKNAEKLKSTKEEIKKERELPNTNSTSILTTLVSSVIGTLSLGYKSKRRK